MEQSSRTKSSPPVEAHQLNAGQIYKGRIISVKDFGFFVRIKDPVTGYEREGLVHVGQIRSGTVRLETARDSGYDVDNEVYAKLIQIREDGKISLSMKECDQTLG